MPAPVKAKLSPGEYPRTYKAQRILEKKAAETREAQAQMGVQNLPSVCGYEYKPLGNRNPQKMGHEPIAICYRNAGAGTSHPGRGLCDYHEVDFGVRIEKMPAKERKAVNVARQMAYDSAKFFGEPVNIDPHTALLEEVHRTAGIVRWLEDKLVRLRDVDAMPEDEVLIQYSKQHGLVPSVWMTLYQQERDRLINVSMSAIKAGVAERRVQLAEQTGQAIAQIMLAFIRDPDLGLTPQQMLGAPDIIRRHLTMLPSTEHTPTVVEVSGEELRV